MHYTTSCNTQSSAPADGLDQRPKHVALFGIINKPLLLHLVGVYIICLLLLLFLNVKPDDGCVMQKTHAALWIAIIQRCVWTVCVIVIHCSNTARNKHIAIESVKFSYRLFAFVYYYIQILNIRTLGT